MNACNLYCFTDSNARIIRGMAKKQAITRDSAYMTDLGRSGGEATKKQKPKSYFSNIAKLSHPRKSYNGGRPRKVRPAPAAEKAPV